MEREGASVRRIPAPTCGWDKPGARGSLRSISVRPNSREVAARPRGEVQGFAPDDDDAGVRAKKVCDDRGCATDGRPMSQIVSFASSRRGPIQHASRRSCSGCATVSSMSMVGRYYRRRAGFRGIKPTKPFRPTAWIATFAVVKLFTNCRMCPQNGRLIAPALGGPSRHGLL